MSEKRDWMAVMLAAGLSLWLAALPLTAGAATPGDPDGDGLPTLEEQAYGTNPLQGDTDGDGLLDGWEKWFTSTAVPVATNPLKASTNGVRLDGFLDRDGGGICDAQELANGTNPNDAADDARLRKLVILAPAPRATGWGIPAVPYNNPDVLGNAILYDVPDAADPFIRKQLQFDASPTFDSPVSSEFTHVLDRPTTIVWVRRIWNAVTKEGRLVYWRIVGEVNGRPQQVVSSNILAFVVSGGPGVKAPVNGYQSAAGARPTFSWTGTGFTAFRLMFTGSKKPSAPYITTAIAGTTFSYQPTQVQWAAVSALGEDITWSVIGIGGGRWAVSRPRMLRILGGASALAASGDLPTFSFTAGSATQWRILFSPAEDFASPTAVFPNDGSWFETSTTTGWTPGITDWQLFTCAGPEIFWTIQSYSPADGATYYPVGFNRYEIDKSFGITELNAATTPNLLTPAMQNFSVALLDSSAPSYYRLLACTDKRCSGGKAADPAAGYLAYGTSPVAYVQQAVLPNTAEANFSTRLANLGPSNLWLMAVGREGEYCFYSEPYMVKPDYFLLPPTLSIVPTSVKVDIAYTVGWTDSVNGVGKALYYQLQEALDPSFTVDVQSYDINSLSSVFTKTGIDESARFYYRVRAVNSFGHGGWSNFDSIIVEGPNAWKPVYISGPMPAYRPPFCALWGTTKNFAIDDLQSINDRYDAGRFYIEGTGWVRVSRTHHYGHGFNADALMVSRAVSISGREKATWVPKIKTSGVYRVWLTWYMSDNRPEHVEFFLKSDDKPIEAGPYVVDQRQNLYAPGTQTWLSLGNHRFTAGGSYYIQERYNPVFNNPSAGSHSLEADAVIFQYVGP